MPTITAEPRSSPHAALIAALQAGDPEPAIEQAHRQITTRGGDVPLLLALVAALARCGLAGVAQRMVASGGEALQRRPDVQSVLDHIAGLPTGAIDAAVLRDRFQRNRDVALSRFPKLVTLLAEAASPPSIRIYRSRAGNQHALRDSSSPRFDTVFPFIDFRAAAASLRLPPTDLSTSFLMVGVPSPQLLTRLTHENVSGYRPAIDIIEPDREAFIIWLHLLEEASLLDVGRLGVFVGERALDDYRDSILNSPVRTPASLIFTNHRPGWSPPRVDSAMMQELGRQIRLRQIDARSRLDQRLASCDAAHWRQRFADAANGCTSLRVVGFTSRYSTVIQHAMRDLAAAFLRRGHQFEIIAQPNDHTPSVDVASALSSRECDLIIAINHLRFEYADSMPRNLPFVGWIQDHLDHLWKREAGESVGDLDLVIAHAPHVLSSLYGYPSERLLASSNLTDAHTYSAEPLPEGQLCAHRCDLSFVSHGAATPEALVEELGAATTPAFHRMLKAFLQIARDELQERGCGNAQGLVELMLLAEERAGGPALPPHVRRAHVYPQIAKIHDRLFRHQTLEWAANWARSRQRTFCTYGRGWDRHATLGAFAAGEIASGTDLRAVYQASTISLQANAYASLHQRLLDGLACGACMIARYNPADFVRGPFARIAETIGSRGLKNLDEVVTLRARDADFDAVCAEAERLSNAVIALSSDSRRQQHMRALRRGNDIAELQNDDGLFAVLRDMRFIPARVASDLPGFEQIVFRDEAQMHALLDRLVDDEALRRSITAPMREAVLEHDTYDALVGRVVSAFARGSVAQ